ncbi:hypothetical protein Nepgr_021893 [Nepenthes gracilis]|uniref:Uncharacterized protein n=1 Tax=Nepenthes gracilis TaxID=150966 RepID=A0AAD3XWB3_NEPGR|nr:hypothetical protein Nepgr_021893 [Nepenthes gracilis]
MHTEEEDFDKRDNLNYNLQHRRCGQFTLTQITEMPFSLISGISSQPQSVNAFCSNKICDTYHEIQNETKVKIPIAVAECTNIPLQWDVM